MALRGIAHEVGAALLMDQALLHTLVSVSCSLVVGIGGSYITFRLQWAAFQAKDVEREKHWTKWRDGITADVESLKRPTDVGAIAVLSQRVFEVERRLGGIENTLHDLSTRK
jgi:hypothetical protein